MAAPSSDEQIKFLVNVQRLLNEGSFVATYKYALLLAITDLCVEKGDESGAPLRLTVRELAEKFILFYWRQTAPYVAADRERSASHRSAGAVDLDASSVGEMPKSYRAAGSAGRASVLKQNTGRQARIVQRIESRRAAYGGSLYALRTDANAWRALVAEVAATVTTMPLWRLQIVGQQKLEFLYRRGAAGEIELLPGVAYCGRRFHALIRDLVQAAWVRFLRQIPENAAMLGEGHELSEFLFGSERAGLERYRPILRDVQRDECFYCRRPLRAPGEVDHFVPWSIYGLDLGHNFVLAHATCNQAKRDRVAAVQHLDRWCERNVRRRAELEQRFDGARLLHDLPSTWQVTRWAYAQAEASGAQVWLASSDALTLLAPDWRAVLDGAAGAAREQTRA